MGIGGTASLARGLELMCLCHPSAPPQHLTCWVSHLVASEPLTVVSTFSLLLHEHLRVSDASSWLSPVSLRCLSEGKSPTGQGTALLCVMSLWRDRGSRPNRERGNPGGSVTPTHPPLRPPPIPPSRTRGARASLPRVSLPLSLLAEVPEVFLEFKSH